MQRRESSSGQPPRKITMLSQGVVNQGLVNQGLVNQEVVKENHELKTMMMTTQNQIMEVLKSTEKSALRYGHVLP